MLIGGGKNNRLLVTDGAQVVSYGGRMGNIFPDSSNNLAVVTGAGSTWSNATELRVGDLGARNNLVVSNGGAVFAGSALYLGVASAATNNRVTVDAATLRVTNATATGLLEVRRGTAVLKAGLIEADIVRMTNSPQSVLAFNGGTLSAKSSRIASGTILSSILVCLRLAKCRTAS